MTNSWYYYDGAQACGPFQENEIRDLIDCGVVKEDTFVASANDTARGWVIAAGTELSAFFKENSESDAKENPEHVAEENSGFVVVVEDTQRFSLSLGFSSNEELISSGIYGVLSGVAVGVTAAGVGLASTVAGLGFLGKLTLAVGLTGLSAPIAIPVALGVGTAAGVGGFTYLKKRFGNNASIRGKKSFNTPVDRLGYLIAQKIFVPTIALIKASEREDFDFVKGKMKEWGYYENYIDDFVTDFATMSQAQIINYFIGYNDVLKKEMKKKTKKLSKEDVSLALLNFKTTELAKKYLSEFGGSDELLKIIETSCK